MVDYSIHEEEEKEATMYTGGEPYKGNRMLQDRANSNQSLQFRDSIQAGRDAYAKGHYDATGTYTANKSNNPY